jgi:hypothetical protein
MLSHYALLWQIRDTPGKIQQAHDRAKAEVAAEIELNSMKRQRAVSNDTISELTLLEEGSPFFGGKIQLL